MIRYHVWVVSHCPVFLLVFYQFKQDGQIDDVFLVQTKFFLQHISVPVDTVLSERENKLSTAPSVLQSDIC